MIRIGNYLELDEKKYDENWMIVRKPDEMPEFAKHVPALSPSPELFRKYRAAYHEGKFNQKFFDEVYVPQFLMELSENEEAMNMLQMLVEISDKKDIFLACYCEVETMCHRSIIAGVLLGMGAVIDTKEDYIKYATKLRDISARHTG